MALVPFDGQLDEDSPKGLIPFTGKLDTDKRGFSLSNALGFAGAGIGNMADTALSSLAGGAAALAGDQEAALSIDEEMRNRRDRRSKWYSDPSFAEKAVGIVGTLPAQMVGMGLSPAETAFVAKESGESNSAALKAAGLDAALNAVGVAIPGFKQGSLAVRAGTGAAVNAGQDYASKLAIQQVLETEKGKQAFQPTLEDAALAGVIGGGLGASLGRSPTPAVRPTAAQIEADFSSKAATPKVVDAAPIEKLTALEDSSKQMSLWDIDESVQAGHKYQAEFGDWRVDENGIPIRADLSMELQADQAPLQRDMFVDQNGNFAKQQDTGYYNNLGELVETPTKSMQQALDEMGWAQKRGALKKSGLMHGDLEASGQLKAAAMEAELASPQTRSGDPSLVPFNYKKQGGGLLVDFKKKKQAPDGEDIIRLTRQIDELGRRYVDGRMEFSEYTQEQTKLSYELALAEQLQRKRQENVPATSVEPVFPGYPNSIPIGTKVQASHGMNYPKGSIGTVVGTYGLRYGEKAWNAPIVDFGEGRGRKVLPNDLEEVFGPRPTTPFNYKKQGGAIDPSVFKEGYRKFTKALSTLTDKLGADPVWQASIRARLGGDYMTNPDGTPMVQLHGTTREIRGELQGQNQGFHSGFTSSPHMFIQGRGPINNKAIFSSERTKKNAQLYPVVIKKGNYPYIATDLGTWTPDRVLDVGTETRNLLNKIFIEQGLPQSQIDGLYNYVWNTPRGKLQNKALTDILKRAGIDGFFYQNKAESVKGHNLTTISDRYLKSRQPPTDFKGFLDHYHGKPGSFENSYADAITNPRVASYENPTSFVTWDDKNFVSVYDTQPKTSTYVPKSQRGNLLIKWGADANKAEVLNKLPGMKKALGAFVPEKLTTDQVIERAKATGEKDVQQNVLQRGANWFTKGALYQAQKTGNSFIAKTAQDWLQADRTSRGEIQQFIHDDTAPAFRAMSNDEATTVGMLINFADKYQEKITPEMMERYNLSDKQRTAIDSHQRLMDKAFTAINDARAAAGKDPIDRRTAYAAMRAEGDFKRVVYKNINGEKTVVGVIGSNFSTKGVMGAIRKDSTMRFIKDLEAKGYEVGDERPFTGFSNRNQSQLAFQQAMEHMAETNPATKEFLDVISQISQDNAYAFLNAKKHTLAKKGVFGMEGRKEWVGEYQNAKDLLESQLLYAENAFRWAEYSKAMQETKKLLSSDVDMPNAKQWIERYTNNALGINPSVLGKNLEDTVNQAFTSIGVGPTAIQQGGAVARQVVNTLLLGLSPGFLLTQMIQPSMALPALSSYLKTKGVGNTGLMMEGYFAWGVAAGSKKLMNSKNITPLEADAFNYAKKNSVYVTDLVDTSTKARKDVGYAFDKLGSFLSAPLEASTRSSVFMAYVKLLNDSGMSKADGLFETAHNLTDVTMVNYNKIERPMAFNSMGVVGDLGVNLQSFKFNELSKLSLFVREAAKDKSFNPILTQMATYIVAAGVMGIPGYQELESLYKEITKVLGKPDSLNLRVLEAQAELSKKLNVEDKKVMSHGVPSLMGVDLSKRLSMSNLAPDTVLDFMFPGASKLTAIAGAGYQLGKNPTDEMTQKNFVREALPIGTTGPLDRTWYEQDVKGGRAGIKRTDLMRSTGASITPGPVRNEKDRFWKTLGMTGINESVQKDKLWQLKEQDMAYAELRSKALSKMIRKAYVSGSYAENTADYIEAQGDAGTLERELSEKLKAGKISAVTAAKIKAGTAKTIPQMRGAQRTMEALGENE